MLNLPTDHTDTSSSIFSAVIAKLRVALTATIHRPGRTQCTRESTSGEPNRLVRGGGVSRGIAGLGVWWRVALVRGVGSSSWTRYTRSPRLAAMRYATRAQPPLVIEPAAYLR
jgi:hypothetical protein